MRFVDSVCGCKWVSKCLSILNGGKKVRHWQNRFLLLLVPIAEPGKVTSAVNLSRFRVSQKLGGNLNEQYELCE